MKSKIAQILILLGTATVLVYFQNCARPGDKANQDFTVESLNDDNIVVAQVGEDVTLSVPLDNYLQMVGIDDPTFPSPRVAWTFINTQGIKTPIDHDGTELVLERLTKQDRGTYRAVVQIGREIFTTNFRVDVDEIYGAQPSQLATFQYQYVNDACDTQAIVTRSANNLTYDQAERACDQLNKMPPADRYQRAVLCRWNGKNFRMLANLKPKRLFESAQISTIDNSVITNFAPIPEIDRCEARLRCAAIQKQFDDQGLDRSTPRCRWDGGTISPSEYQSFTPSQFSAYMN